MFAAVFLRSQYSTLQSWANPEKIKQIFQVFVHLVFHKNQSKELSKLELVVISVAKKRPFAYYHWNTGYKLFKLSKTIIKQSYKRLILIMYHHSK